ncbi:phosphate ABC transporter permease subunit PstC [Luteococcus sp. H154]|uniref:phosphate ABC transporter permease subunit PstC n=1 Tax=unclassified Luteococcus TaxID=2639923 RepID=UPI00313DE013
MSTPGNEPRRGAPPIDATESPADLVPHHEPHAEAPTPTVRRAVASQKPAAATTAVETAPVHLDQVKRGADLAFKSATGLSAGLIVSVVGFIAVFLLALAIPALGRNNANFLTSNSWDLGNAFSFGIAGLLWTTVFSSIIAMMIAVPIAIGVALLITHYAKGKLANTVGFMVDLLAAVPSVVYGLWGLRVLGPTLVPVGEFLSKILGWIPIFKPGLLPSPGTVFTASTVLAIMILPIVTSISRDVFAQTPRDHIEAAWALGATKTEMIRTAVIPYGRSGVTAAAMLGLGRALGETVAVMIILSTVQDLGFSIFDGGETFAARIANGAGELDSADKTGAYIAAGLVLFVLTFVVNAIARTLANAGKVKA